MIRNTVITACLVALFGSTGAAAQADPSNAARAAEAEAMVLRGEGLSRRVSSMLSDARRESDIIRITCLGDKLTQVNALLGNARQRLQTLKESGDAGQQKHEHTVLMVLGQKFQVLDQEAAQCVGQAMFETGTTRVQTDIDPATVPFDEAPASSPPPVVLPPPPGGVDLNIVLPPPASNAG